MKYIGLLILIFTLNVNASTEVGEYDGGSGRNLKYVLGVPNVPSNKLFIYIQGDGSGCFAFDEVQTTGFMTALALSDYWISPETAKEFLCVSGKYRTLDFQHRVIEVKNLVTKMRADKRFSTADIYLIGHSAGTDVAAQAAQMTPGIKGIVLMGGGSLSLDAMMYHKTLIDGYGQGKPEDQIQNEIQKTKQLANKIKNDCSITQFSWGDRNNLFWCQLFQVPLEEVVLSIPKSTKLFLIHGQKDNVVPVEEAFSLYSKALSKDQDASLKVYADMEHNFFPKIKDILFLLSQWAK